MTLSFFRKINLNNVYKNCNIFLYFNKILLNYKKGIKVIVSKIKF